MILKKNNYLYMELVYMQQEIPLITEIAIL